MTIEQFIPFDVEPPPDTQPSTPHEISVSMDDIQDIEKKRRRLNGFWLSVLVTLLALCFVGAAVAIGLLLNPNVTDNPTHIDDSSTSTTIMSSTITTTTANCVSPYVVGSSGSCVNVLIDINNCGSAGYICPFNYTSCSAGVCSTAPAVQLTNGNFIWTAALNGSVDDNYYNLNIPFNITLYNTTTSSVYVTTNGVLCLGSCSSVYTETPLPTTAFPGATVLPYWDDLFIYAGTSQGIYYGTEGNAPNRTLIFEFYMSHFNQPSQYYHYQVIFFEGIPGVVQFKYYDASDGGVTCTVGVQASGSGPFIQYSFDLANSVRSNMSLTFDTNNGVYTNSTF